MQTYEQFKKRYQFDANDPNCRLGEGGFGEVFKAYDTIAKCYVAIKRGEVKSNYGKFTLQREVELNKKVPYHPNIIQYNTCYRFENMVAKVDFAVMPFYPLGDIGNLIKEMAVDDGPPDFYDETIKELILGILLGIKHLHDNDIIHRDLKTGNILVEKIDGVYQVKIADFGLSKKVDKNQLSFSNSSIGVSWHYAAPEQIQGGSDKVKFSTDLWAVGVILFQICWGGRLPFDSSLDTPEARRLDIAEKITSGQIPKCIIAIKEPYRTIIKRCLQTDMRKRAQTAAKLLHIMNSYYGVDEEERTVVKKSEMSSDEKTKVLEDKINNLRNIFFEDKFSNHKNIILKYFLKEKPYNDFLNKRFPLSKKKLKGENYYLCSRYRIIGIEYNEKGDKVIAVNQQTLALPIDKSIVIIHKVLINITYIFIASGLFMFFLAAINFKVEGFYVLIIFLLPISPVFIFFDYLLRIYLNSYFINLTKDYNSCKPEFIPRKKIYVTRDWFDKYKD